MANGIKVWLNSGANVHSCREQEFTWEELGMTEAAWDDLPEDEQEDYARDLAFNHSDWGYTKV